MKAIMSLVVGQLVLIAMASHVIAGDFVNLDFERGYESQPVIGPLPDGSGSVVRDWWLPGWKWGDSLHDDVYSVPFNWNWPGASDGGTLYGRGYYFGRVPLSGNLAVLGFRSSFPSRLIHITQSGLIPADAKSMWYDCANGPWEVTINGIKLDLYDPHRGTKPEMEFRELGVDVSEWAGKEVELRLMQMPGWTFNAVDNIRFSAEAIQEPNQATLLIIGSASLWVISRRRSCAFHSLGVVSAECRSSARNPGSGCPAASEPRGP